MKTKADWVCFYTRSPIARGWVHHPCAIDDPRGRVAVRASSSAAARCILLRLPRSAPGHCALARANRVFGTDEKRIRTKNTVMVKSKDDLELFLYEIADWARTGSRPRTIVPL
jgi:hypothetical protein